MIFRKLNWNFDAPLPRLTSSEFTKWYIYCSSWFIRWSSLVFPFINCNFILSRSDLWFICFLFSIYFSSSRRMKAEWRGIIKHTLIFVYFSNISCCTNHIFVWNYTDKYLSVSRWTTQLNNKRQSTTTQFPHFFSLLKSSCVLPPVNDHCSQCS